MTEPRETNGDYAPGAPEPFDAWNMHSTDPEVIAQQLRDGMGAEGNYFPVFNNFAERLPGGHFRGLLTPDLEGLPAIETGSESQAGLHSDLLARQTYGEFMAAIDLVIAGLGDDFAAKIDELQAARSKAVSPQSGELRNELLKHSVPVYVGLRTTGYSHYDLIQ